MEQAEDLTTLQRLPILDAFPEDAKERAAKVFLSVSEIWELSDGEVLLQEGYLAFDSGYALLEGNVEIQRENKDAITVSGPALLGEMSQFRAGDTRTATVVAKGPARVLQFSWEEFNDSVREKLSEEEQAFLKGAIERLIWDRFNHPELATLALFHGLDDALRMKVCMVFGWITEPKSLADGAILFKEGDRCETFGYLLTLGKVLLTKKGIGERDCKAPDIIGVLPQPKPDQCWSLGAKAQGAVEFFRFSWKTYTTQLTKRLSEQELAKLVESMKEGRGEHFWQ